MEVQLNFLSVLVAGLASMGLGFFWYSPMLLGNPWMKMMGYTKESMSEAQKKMGMMYVLSFAATLIMAWVLTYVIQYSQYATRMDWLYTGLSTGFWMWLGFVAPVQITDVIFGNKQWKLFAINTGYQLVSLLIMGAILGVWR